MEMYILCFTLGAASPHAVKKLLALSEQGKTRPKLSPSAVANTPSLQQGNLSNCSPISLRKGHGGVHHLNSNAMSQTGQHSNASSSNGGQTSVMGSVAELADTVTLPVDLTAESSSVSSLSRKIQNGGKLYFFL